MAIAKNQGGAGPLLRVVEWRFGARLREPQPLNPAGKERSTATTRRAKCLQHQSGGFTLLELIVVLATIAIIAGMILPALATSQTKSQQIQCLNNVRQLNVGFQLYASDNGGTLVQNNSGHYGAAWVDGFFAGTGSYATNLAVKNDPRLSLFAPYISVSENANVYECPSENAKGTPHSPIARSYALNSYMGWAGAVYHNQGDPKSLSEK